MSLALNEELSREGEAMIETAKALVVGDDQTYVLAGERRKLVKAYLARVADLFDPIDRAQIESRRVTITQRRSVEQYAIEADEIYKRGRLAYEAEQNRLRLEAEARAIDERARLEANAAFAADQERRRLQAEEDDRRLRAAVDAEARGDIEAAERILARPSAVPVVRPAPIFAPPLPAPAEPPKVEGIVSRTEWTYEITEPFSVPREYLQIDHKAIGAVVRALKAQTKIPGVRVFARMNESVRAT